MICLLQQCNKSVKNKTNFYIRPYRHKRSSENFNRWYIHSLNRNNRIHKFRVQSNLYNPNTNGKSYNYSAKCKWYDGIYELCFVYFASKYRQLNSNTYPPNVIRCNNFRSNKNNKYRVEWCRWIDY